MSSFETLVCDLEKDKADYYGYKDSYFHVYHLPLLLPSPWLSSLCWSTPGKWVHLCSVLYPCILVSLDPTQLHVPLTPQQLCLKVQWPSESCRLRSPLGHQLSINVSQTFPSACWYVRSFLPPGPLGKQQAASVLLWFAAHNVWPGVTGLSCLGLFLPKLIE